MKDMRCCICLDGVDGDNAPILTMSGAGVPRCLCERCAADVDTVTEGREYPVIIESIDRLSANLSEKNIDDPITLNAMTSLLARAAKRAKLIGEGSYDFSLDEVVLDEDGNIEEILEEIPEELLENDADREMDAEEEEKLKRLDKILNWVWAAVLIGVVGLMVWWLFF